MQEATALRITYNSAADVLHVELADSESIASMQQMIAPGVIVSFDAGRRLLGMEALNASQHFPPAQLASAEKPSVEGSPPTLRSGGSAQPQKLFKYLRPEHAQAMVETGKVRLGTLRYYRQQELLAPLIGDSRDGTRTLIELQEGDGSTFGELSPFAKQVAAGTMGGLGDSVFMRNNTFVGTIVAPNCYVYCASYERSAAAAGEYAACVEITDRKMFFLALSQALVQQLRCDVRMMQAIVRYEPEQVDARMAKRRNPAFTKTEEFRKQREVRAIWLPLKPGTPEPDDMPAGIDYLDLEIPELRPFVSRIEIP